MPSSDVLLDQMVVVAQEAVAEAAKVCRYVQARLDEMRAITKDDRSPVTIADFASQAVVARRLREAGLIGDGDAGKLVAEESGAFLRQAEHGAHLEAALEALRESGAWEAWGGEPDAPGLLEAIDLGGHEPVPGRGDEATYWTLDPIDGTKGFLRGPIREGDGPDAGQYAIALAYIERGQVRLGVLGCPNLALGNGPSDEIADGRGSLLWSTLDEGVRARRLDGGAGVQDVPRRGESVEAGRAVRVAESVESGHTSHSASAAVFEAAGLRTEGLRLDSQCKYAVCAMGVADVYLRLPTKKGYIERIWDHAAGAIVAENAGLVVSDVDGKRLDFSHGRGLEVNRGIVVAPRYLHGRLIEAAKRIGI